MIEVAGTFRLGAGGLDAARPAMARMIAASRAEPGCLAYGYAVDVLDPNLVHVRELWISRAALDLHFTLPHLLEWRAAWPELGLTDRSLTASERVDPQAV